MRLTPRADATDTVCSDCAAGTYSSAGATTCTICGSCDDGDACTADACDKTRGCVHTAIAGCTPSVPDAGTPGEDGSAPQPSDPDAAAPSGDGGSPEEPAGDSGCNVATRTRGGSGALTGIAAFAYLLLTRRRRERRAP